MVQNVMYIKQAYCTSVINKLTVVIVRKDQFVLNRFLKKQNKNSKNEEKEGEKGRKGKEDMYRLLY